MSQQFSRKIKIKVFSERETLELNPDLDISFTVRKDRSTSPNELTLSVTNLSDTSRQFIQAGRHLELYGGYSDQLALIAKCDIARRVTQWQPPDSVTEIQCLDGYLALKDKRITLGLADGATVSAALQSTSRQMGLSLISNDEILLRVPLKGGYTHTGTAAQALDDLASIVDASWGIVNNTLVFSSRGKALSGVKVLTISPQNGLLAQPEVLDDTVISERVLPKAIKPKGYQLTMLLRPQLNPFDLIEVESRFVNGLYVIDQIEHVGSNTDGDFITRATVYERQ